jgi:hypothetical protein
LRGYPYHKAFPSAGVSRHSLKRCSVDINEISSPTEQTRYAGCVKTRALVFHFLVLFIYLVFFMVYAFCVFFQSAPGSFILFWYINFFCGASTRTWVMASPYVALRSHSLDTPLLWKNDQLDATVLYSAFGKSLCAYKTRFSIERTIVSKN